MTKENNLPLAVDLDGTFIKTDTLFEMIIAVLVQKPLAIINSFQFLLKGKAQFKTHLAQITSLDYQSLPRSKTFGAWLQKQTESQRDIYLVTGAPLKVAKEIADQENIFKDVMATTPDVNLTGKKKAALLIERFGEKGFDYAGNCEKDLSVWKHAKNAIICNGNNSLHSRVIKFCSVSHQFNDVQLNLKNYLNAIRIHQWTKNLLVFIPLIASHLFIEQQKILESILAFISFSMASSIVYLFNDLTDLQHDRLHEHKRHRPLASGNFPLASIVPTFLVLSFILISSLFFLPINFLFIILGYFTANIFYSLLIKRIVVLDVIFLALLYMIRVYAGGIATDIVISEWLLLFSVFMFFGLALAKRYSEILCLNLESHEPVPGRGYSSNDLHQISSIGVASLFISILVYCLYISGEAANFYSRPSMLWLGAVVLIYWFSRIWILAGRGEITEDPLLFAFKDKGSIIAGVVFCLMILASL